VDQKVDLAHNLPTLFQSARQRRASSEFIVTSLLARSAIVRMVSPQYDPATDQFLTKHVMAGRLDADAAAAYAMAKDVSDRGAKRLRTLIESMGR
jgi:hypothetical protein